MFGDTRRSANSTRRGGFTLTEMMAVMLIMTVLVLLVVGVSRYVQVKAAGSETDAYQAIIKQAFQAYYEDEKAYPTELKTFKPRANGWALADWKVLCRGDNLFDQLKGNERSESMLRTLPTAALGKVTGLEPSTSGPSTRIFFADGFKSKMDYDEDGGIGGVPVILSGGPDKNFATTEDNIRSDEGY